MIMHNPPHPGEFIREVYLEPFGISYRTVAAKLKVAPSTFNRLINGQSNISSEMALRLSKTLGRSPESWLIMQNNFNLWHARQRLNLDRVEKLRVPPQKFQHA
ncbi:MAG: HigA family addiction module antidote protein [Bacteroidetes bacterium]|nr:HigA family addiction module antidote protein [Bacteroidota bacterium]MCH7724465.1 HigA family addiction module antidote protein [Bacteroidota bacterium]